MPNTFSKYGTGLLVDVGLVVGDDACSRFFLLVGNDHVLGATDPLRDTCLIVGVHLPGVPGKMLSEVLVADATLLGPASSMTES